MGAGAVKGCLYALMFVNLGVLLFLFRRQHTYAKPVVAAVGIALSVIAIGCALVIVKYDGWQAQKMRVRIAVQEAKYQRIGFKLFGQAIAEKHPGAKILVVLHESYEFPDSPEGQPSLGDLQWQSLQEGLGSVCTVIGIEKVQPELDYELMDMVPRKRTAGMKIYSAKVLDDVIAAHKEADVVLLLAGLPIDYQEMKFWKIPENDRRPVLVLSNSSPFGLKKAIRKNFISLMLLNHVWTDDFDSPVPEDEKEAFGKRYLIVTADNLDELAEKHPKLF